MKIKLVDLKANYLSIKDEIDRAIQEVLDSTAFIMGRYVDEFEHGWAAYCGVKHAIGVSNGSDAVRLAVKAVGVGPGDEVITVSNTFIATSEAASAAGGVPVFVDIDSESYCMDPQKVEAAITKKTKAIICVHLYGHACDMDEILRIAAAHELRVIEDCAQCHGARYKGKMVGTIGDVGCYSMFPAKILGAFGDAGAVVTNHDEIAGYIRLQRNHGRVSKYDSAVEGSNARLDAMQAKILSVKLMHLDHWISARRRLANRYTENLDGVVKTPSAQPWAFHPYYMYVVQTDDRDALMKRLSEKNIECGIHYPLPLHLQKAYAHLQMKKGDLPMTERVAGRILSIPLYPEMTEQEQDYVIETIRP